MEKAKKIELESLHGRHPSRECIEDALRKGTEELRVALQASRRTVGYPTSEQMTRLYNI